MPHTFLSKIYVPIATTLRAKWSHATRIHHPELHELEPRVLYNASPVGDFLDVEHSAISEPIDFPTDEIGAVNEQNDYSFVSESEPLISPPQEIVFIDQTVDNYSVLFEDLASKPDIAVYLLDGSIDGVDQISRTLSQHTGLSAVHIVSHGSSGAFHVGSSHVSNSNVYAYSEQFFGWHHSLSADADLLIYGCDVAGSEEGRMLVETLETLTGLDVAASDDLTGNQLRGADWELEYVTGDIESQVVFSAESQLAWAGTLFAPADLVAVATSEGGLSLNLDGGNAAYLEADNGNEIFGGKNQLSIEVRLSLGSQPFSPHIIDYATSTHSSEFSLWMSGSSDVVLQIGDVGYTFVGNYSELRDGEIHSIGLTWSGGTASLYIDGDLRAQMAAVRTGYTIASGGNLVVGQDQTALGSNFVTDNYAETKLFDLRIFDSLRTDQEIHASYAAELPHHEPGLIADWRFDQLSANGVVTDSVNDNSLTVKQTNEIGFTPSSTSLSLSVKENSLNSTVVGSVVGLDFEREVMITTLLAQDSTLRYSSVTNEFYKFWAGSGDYTTALANAGSQLLLGVGGQLASIRSAHEQAVVYDAYLAGGGSTLAWLGASDAIVDGEWYWEDDLAGVPFWIGAATGSSPGLQYSNFLNGPPDLSVVANYLSVTNTGYWNNSNATLASDAILQWDADDVLDTGQSLTYSIQSQTTADAFAIDADSGEIMVVDGSLLDYETNSTHSLTVRVADVDGAIDRVIDISLTNRLEDGNTPSDLSGGIELNTNGGETGYLVANDGDAILSGLNALTVEVSLSVDSFDANDTLLSYRSPADLGDSDDAFLLSQNGLNQLQVIISGIAHDFNFDVGSLADGRVHSVAVSWESSSGNLGLYVDGELVDSTTNFATGQSIRAGGALVLGLDQNAIEGDFSPGSGLKGTLYDVRIWNEVRSQAELELNYQHKFDTSNLPGGLVANWQMDGFNGMDEVVDAVSGNNLSKGAGTTSQSNLNIDENSANGSSVGYVVPSQTGSIDEIVDDGNFAQENISLLEVFYEGETFGGWTVTRGSAQLESHVDPGESGGQAVALTGLPSAIGQSLDTVAGQQYQVIFEFSGDPTGVEEVFDGRISAAGQSLDFSKVAPPNWSVTHVGWEQRSWMFTATSDVTELEIEKLDTSSKSILLSGVSVLKVPAEVSAVLDADASLSYDAGTGKFYRLANSPTNFSNALNSATGSLLNGISGELVTIESAYENNLLRSWVIEAGNPIWLGITDAASAGTWVEYDGATANGDTVVFSGTYVAGQYSNIGDLDGFFAEDYASIDVTGAWRDSGDFGPFNYVTQWDANEVISNYSFTLTDSAEGRFAIDSDSGEITVADGSLLNFESDTFHDVTVEVTDVAGNTYSESLSITINHKNEAPAFGVGDGLTTLNYLGAGNRSEFNDVIHQSDGKFLAVGQGDSGTGLDIIVTRYNFDGSLDTGFGGGDGIATIDFGATVELGNSIAVQSNGKIVVAGRSDGATADVALARLNYDGTLDTSFSGDGKVTFDGGGFDWALDVSISPSNKIVVAGHDGTDAFLLQYNEDGTLDSAFGGGDGIVRVDLGALDRFTSIGLQSDGKLVVAGYTWIGSDTYWFVQRYQSDGTLDISFASSGTHLTNFLGYASSEPADLTISSDDSIYVSGRALNAIESDVAVVKYDSDGNLDTSFGAGDGIVTYDLTTGYEIAKGITLQDDSKIVLATTKGPTASVVRLNADGTLDNDFGTAGEVNLSPGTNSNSINATTLSNNRIIAVGTATTGGDPNALVAVLNPDGSLDTGFGLANTLDGNPTYVEDGAAVTLDSNVEIFDAELSQIDDFTGATLTLARAGGADSDDIFVPTGNLVFGISTLELSSSIVGTYTHVGGQLFLTFSNGATNAQVNEVMQSIQYANVSNTPPPSVQLDWIFSDQNNGSQGSGGVLTAIGSTTVNITAVNDQPFLSGPSSNYVVNEQTNLSIEGTGFTISDFDAAGGTLTATLTVGEGVINVSVGDSGANVNSGNGSTTVTITGTVAELNALFSGTSTGTITYFYVDDNPTASSIITLVVNDGGNTGIDPGLSGDGSSEEGIAAQFIQITPINDDPINTGSLPTDVSVIEDEYSFVNLSAIHLYDTDQGFGNLTLTLTTATGGELAVASSLGVAIGGTPTSLTLTGTQADLNNYLNNPFSISYRHGIQHTFGDNADSITIRVNDNGNTGVGGGTDQNLGTVNVDISPVNDNPGYSGLLPDIFATEDVATDIDLSMIDFIDVDAGNGVLTVTLTTGTGGQLMVSAGAGITLGGTSSARTFSGTLTDLNNYFDNASNINYQHGIANTNGNYADAIFVSINDHGNTGSGGGTDQIQGRIDVHISAVNDLPTNSGILPTDLSVLEDTATNIDLSALDLNDVDSGNGDLTVTLVTSTGGQLTAATGTGITIGGTAKVRTIRGSLVDLNNYFNNTSSLSYLHGTPNTNGDNVDTITVFVNDLGNTGTGGGTDQNLGTVNVDITAVNDDPTNTVSLPSDVTVTEDVSTNVDLSSVDFSDLDSASGTLTVTLSTSTGGQLTGAVGTGISIGGTPAARTFTGTLADLNNYFNNTSSISYVHGTPNTNGDNADTITVVINDNGNIGTGGGTDQNLGTVNVDITAVNDDPTNAGTLPSDVAVTEDVSTNVDLSAVDFSDVDAAGGTLTVTLSTSTGGQLTGSAGTGITIGGTAAARTFTGTLVDLNNYFNNTSSISYLHGTPNTNGDNADTITVVINDNGNIGTGGGTDQNLGTVNVDITSVNDAPTTDDVIASGSEGAASIPVTLTGSDLDGTVQWFSLSNLPANGTLYLDAGLTNPVAIATDIAASGEALTLYFVPDAFWNGSTNFQYSAKDDLGLSDSTPATATINVSAVNDAPVTSTIEGTPVDYDENDGAVQITNTISISDVDDTDIESATIQITGNYVSSEDVLAFTNTLNITGTWDSLTGTLTLTGTDTLANYEAALRTTTFENTSENPSGLQRTVSFTVNDGDNNSNVVSRNIDVIPVNDNPVAVADSVGVNEGGTVNVAAPGLLGNDTDSENDPLTATLLTGPTNGVVVVNADGSYQYTHDGSETTSDSFTYQVSDGAGGFDSATVNITVTPVNDVPVATGDSYSVNEAGILSPLSGVLANDVDADGDPMTASVVSGPANGALTLNSDGTFVYTHDGSETTFDSFTYQVADGNGGFDTAIVNLTINPVNDVPVALDDSYALNEGAVLTVNSAAGVQSNDFDSEGDLLTATLVSGPSNGTITLNANGSFVYTHDGSETTTDQFVYQVDDGNGGVDSAVVMLTITPVNDAPVANSDNYSVAEETLLLNDVSTNDSDAEGDTLTYSLISGPSFAQSFNLNPDGTFDYVPEVDFFGNDSFSYQVSDGEGGSDSAFVAISIVNVNDTPNLVEDYYVAVNGEVLDAVQGVLDNDFDPDKDPLIAILVDSPNNGTITFRADGTFQYVPNPSFVGTDQFVYVANDGTISGTPIVVTIDVQLGDSALGDEPATDETDGNDNDENDDDNHDSDPLPSQRADDKDDEEAKASNLDVNNNRSTEFIASDFSRLQLVELEQAANVNRASSALFQLVSYATSVAPSETPLESYNRGRVELSLAYDAMLLWDHMDYVAKEILNTKLEFEFDFKLSSLAGAVTLGGVLWILRGGVLLATTLSQLPTWKMIDPLTVLESIQRAPQADDELGDYFQK